MSDIITDLSVNKDWVIRIGDNNQFTITFLNGGVAFDISAYAFSLPIRKFGDTDNLVNLTESTGLTNGGASMTWTSNIGFTSNGITTYLNTNFNPATNGVQFLKNSSCFFVQYSNNLPSVNALDGSLSGSDGIFMRPRSATDTALARLNDAANLSVSSITSSIGLYSIARTGSNARALYKNGPSIGNDTQVSTNIPSLNIFLGCYNNAATPTFTLGQILQYNSCGFGSGTIDQAKLYTAISAFTSNP